MKIEISKIRVGTRIRKDLGDIQELAESIMQDGILVPVIVKRLDKNQYKLLAGNRRLKACKLLKMTSIEAVVKKER